MENLTLKVTTAEGDLILRALQELPHKISNALISKLMQQGNEQLKPEAVVQKLEPVTETKDSQEVEKQ
jgi:hypothetical protein